MNRSAVIEQQQSWTLKDWLEVVSIFTSLVITLAGAFLQLKNDTNFWRYLAVAGYIGFVLVVAWLGLLRKKPHPAVRYAALALFAVVTPLFFTWIGTWIVKAPVSARSQPVERFSYTIYDYSGANSPQGSGGGYLSVTNTYQFNRSVTTFGFDYTIPQKESYAGFVLHFDQPVDITPYQKISVTVKFKDDQARVKISLRDVSENAGGIILGDGQYGDAANRQKQVLHIPIEAFPRVIRSLLYEVEFSVDGDFVNGSNAVEVTDISFEKD